jgi:hypothetical protein
LKIFIYYNFIEDEGALALAKNKTMEMLRVRFNRIGKTGIDALKNSSIGYVYTDGNVPDEDMSKNIKMHSSHRKFGNHVFYAGNKLDR